MNVNLVSYNIGKILVLWICIHINGYINSTTGREISYENRDTDGNQKQ